MEAHVGRDIHFFNGESLEGNSEVIVRVPTGLSAIDWLPDGRMLIAPVKKPTARWYPMPT